MPSWHPAPADQLRLGHRVQEHLAVRARSAPLVRGVHPLPPRGQVGDLQEDVQELTLQPELEQPETGERERLHEAHERAHADGPTLTGPRPLHTMGSSAW
ncbi:hypothetical protein ACF1G5_37590 [Streptomyces coeruleorubidus]|uniref:hypothetical protein n=1 Tax=Streptomyces coeruleorubidus TaxID=116188 RepID=UPI003702AB77